MMKSKREIKMKSKEELKEYLLKYYVDENGDLDLSGLDFSDFDGDIFINNMRVKNNLSQNRQTVGKSLFQNNSVVGNNLFQQEQKVVEDINQSEQKVGGDLYQDNQVVSGNINDCDNEVKGKYLTQTLSNDEDYKIINGLTYIIKK